MTSLAVRIPFPSQGGPGTGLSAEMELKRARDEVRELRQSVVFSLATLVDLKDLGTGIHSTRLASWAGRAAARLGLGSEDLHDVEVACMLHDVGKIGVREEILNKKGSLTEEEYEEIKKHSSYGWSILRLLPGFEKVAEYVLYHHEKWDGSGYPAGLVGEEIPIGARIVAVVDAFDAIVSNRAYRRGVSSSEALRRIEKDSGVHFDSRIAEAFIRTVEESSELSEFSQNASRYFQDRAEISCEPKFPASLPIAESHADSEGFCQLVSSRPPDCGTERSSRFF